MWRPETIKEKAARENPQAARTVTPTPPVEIHNTAENEQALRDGGWGCFVDCLKVIEYLICCCGCCTSYDAYHSEE